MCWLLAGACSIIGMPNASWNWHAQRVMEAELGKIPQTMVAPLGNTPETSLPPVVLQAGDVWNTPDENSDTQMPDTSMAETIGDTENLDFADAFLPEDGVSEKTLAEEVPVSPHGFGPYPELPEGLPPMEPRPYSWIGKDVEAELVMRVMIKAWTEGRRDFYGAIMYDRKVLLHVRNTVYFRYGEKQNPDGSVVTTRILAVPPYIELPPGIMPDARFVEFDDVAIDPYEYLDLP